MTAHIQVDLLLSDIRRDDRYVGIMVPHDPAILWGLHRILDLAETALYDYQGDLNFVELGLARPAHQLQLEMRGMAENIRAERFEEALAMGIDALGVMGELAGALYDRHNTPEEDDDGP